MSVVFDTLQNAIALIPDSDVRTMARFLVGTIHDYSHEHDDDLNHNQRNRLAARKLEEALDTYKALVAAEAQEKVRE